MSPKGDPLFDWGKEQTGGEEAKALGMALSLYNQSEQWKADYHRILRSRPKEIAEPFLAEAFHVYVQALIGAPHHVNTLGGCWYWAIVWGEVEPIGQVAKCRRKKRHRNKNDLYRWPQPKGVQVELKL